MADSDIPGYTEITELATDDYLYVARDDGTPLDKKMLISSIVNHHKDVTDLTGLALLVTSVYHGKCIDCYNTSDQTLTIDTLTSAHDGIVLYVSKTNMGDLVILAPTGVTFDGTHNKITLSSLGYECKLRYNHARALLLISYSGSVVGATV